MPAPERGWEHFDAEARVGVRAWGPSRAAAFAEAALGALALVVDPQSVDERESREVRAQADIPEALLVAWVDECLYVHEIEGFVARQVEVTECSDTVVHGHLLGEPLETGRHRLRAVVKAAIPRGVSMRTAGGQHEVRIIIDV